MKRQFILFALIVLATLAQAQKNKQFSSKIFWTEDFSGGRLPEGWISKAVNDSNIVWECTNQPYPGSYGFDQQAPPISSKSGGFHMQFAPGVKVDKFYRRWEKKNIWPDAYFQTTPIDCSGKSSVVLKFAQNFKWNDWGKVLSDGGLYVGVSRNGTDWKEYEVRQGISSEGDCPNPMEVELNITGTAAFQKTVYLRFYWKGIYMWYWMVDDIELSEALDTDFLASSLSSHKQAGNTFTNADVFRFKVVNLGSKPLEKPFDCYLQVDQRNPVKVTMPFSDQHQMPVIDTVEVAFPPADLTDYGIHRIRFYTALPEDERKGNDTLAMELYSGAYELGAVTGFTWSGKTFTFECNHARVNVEFCRDDIFRIQMAYDGMFTNPAGTDIVISLPNWQAGVKFVEKDRYYLMTTSAVALRAYKNPLRFAMYKPDNSTLVWEENRCLTYGKETVQYLSRGENEYFYGGGMQNGRFSHRDKTILLRIDWNWEEGGAPNPAPFYMSTNGYGALRNTYAPGEYAFKDTVWLAHSEARFDCYYFAGRSLKEILNAYTDITGKPFLPPRWALGMGDANCYNRGAKKGHNTSGHNGTTPDVISLIADQYIANDMPRGWILPNDGYGCGYTKLDSVIVELRKRGFHTGLWTENGVEKIAREVGQYGSRLCKLDVAWVGEGYQFAIDGCKAAYDGIEKNSDARGFIWSVCGWAGTQRNSVVWTGDQKGSWDYIRWHIPTVIGSGLSAQNCATGDVDGIFAGSDKTFTRDLQWKCFTPVFMSMSGWAPKDKQPYVYGEPYTSINRKYLKLKLRLTPYMYSLCHEASETGVPAVRALVLEYPQDPVALGSLARYEFLLGKNFLVAPVYRDEEKRDSIYLPEGRWFDYWDGKVYEGKTWLNSYSAPLDKLPLFVRAGSVIPMYQQMNYDNERPSDTLTLDVYPGAGADFTMFEDEGSNRDYREGKFVLTDLSAVSDTFNRVTEIKIAAAKGDYKGKLPSRSYIIQLHGNSVPKQVTSEGSKLRYCKTAEVYKKKSAGWCFSPDEKNGMVFIKTREIPTNLEVKIRLKY
ncbi:MAG: TIM-barrel domain-containing protein [Bacteroidota bacterium]|jgi:alpha-glucosidase